MFQCADLAIGLHFEGNAASQRALDMPESRTLTRDGTDKAVNATPGALLLAYHELEIKPPRDQYRVSCEDFEKHLELVTRLFPDSDCGRRPTPVSFDDGHRSNLELAVPRLNRNGLQATFFVTAGWIGMKPFALDWSGLAEMLRCGHSVQSHGLTHALLSGCADADLFRELRQSKDLLEDRLGVAVNSISMPGGRWNDRVIKACAAAGYRHAYTSDPLFRPLCQHGISIHGRMMVRRNTTIAAIEKFLTGERWFWFSLRSRHALKKSLKSLMGDKAYHSLWSRVSRREETLAGSQ